MVNYYSLEQQTVAYSPIKLILVEQISFWFRHCEKAQKWVKCNSLSFALNACDLITVTSFSGENLHETFLRMCLPLL